MKAQQLTAFGSTDNFELVEVDAPTPAAGQVLVRVHAVGFNPMEWKIRQGFMEEVFPTPLPAILGSEIAGTVEALGDGVTTLSVGDRVVGTSATGADAEYALADVESLAVVPESASFEQAVTLPIAVQTAVRAISELGIESGHTIVVNGAAGGVGTAAVQLLVRDGFTVVGTASEANQDYVASLGAVPVTYGDGVESRIREAAPQGVDAVFDSAGHGFAAIAIALTGDPKRVLTISDFEAGSLGILLSAGTVPATAAAFEPALALAAAGEFHTEIDATFPLEKLAEAHALSESGHVRGKIVITI